MFCISRAVHLHPPPSLRANSPPPRVTENLRGHADIQGGGGLRGVATVNGVARDVSDAEGPVGRRGRVAGQPGSLAPVQASVWLTCTMHGRRAGAAARNARQHSTGRAGAKGGGGGEACRNKSSRRGEGTMTTSRRERRTRRWAPPRTPKDYVTTCLAVYAPPPPATPRHAIITAPLAAMRRRPPDIALSCAK